jgi:hypothetical protein
MTDGRFDSISVILDHRPFHVHHGLDSAVHFGPQQDEVAAFLEDPHRFAALHGLPLFLSQFDHTFLLTQGLSRPALFDHHPHALADA